MPRTRGVQAAGGRPGPARRVVQFCARESIEIAIITPRNEDLAVGQQRRAVPIAAGVEAACDLPSSARRVVQFRARESAAIRPPCNEDLAVGEQGRAVIKAADVEAARGVECKWGIAALRDCRLTIPRH